MSDDQQQAEALEAVRSAITDADATQLLKVLQAEPHKPIDEVVRRPASVEGLQHGVRLVRAIDRLTDAQRNALQLGVQLAEQKRQLVEGLLHALSATEPRRRISR